RRAFVFEPRSLETPALPQPAVAYVVRHAQPRPQKARGVDGRSAELIGREEEVGKLERALAEALQGRGQMVSLIGEAGIGKSRLVTELKAVSALGGVPRLSGIPSPCEDAAAMPLKRGTPADTPQSLWLEGRCLELTMTSPYFLFVDLFRD